MFTLNKSHAVIALAFAFLCAFAGNVGAQSADVVLHVDIANGSLTGDGSDWGADAFRFLQDALAHADFLHQTVDPNLVIHIWLAEGTYRPDQRKSNTHCDDNGTPSSSCCPPFGDCEPDAFLINGNIEVYGGFSGNGTEISLEERNPVLYPTILSGDLMGNDPQFSSEDPLPLDFDFALFNDNSEVVIALWGFAPRNVVLDGVTVRGGYGGGGIHVLASESSLAGVGKSVLQVQPALARLRILK